MTITNEPSTALKTGRVVTVAGPVVDVEFPADHLPEINQAIRYHCRARRLWTEVRAEVAQHRRRPRRPPARH